jgi:hypothetical protein
MKNTITLLGTTLIVAMLSSCGGDSKKEEKEKIDSYALDSSSSVNAAFEGKLFSIPSPIETAILIKAASPNYDAGLLNDAGKVSNYATSMQRALNLGIYGADLAYATLYGQNKECLNYLKALQNLGDNLGISGAFDADFIKRFEVNSTNQDSLLVVVQDAYRMGDNFLKKNEQKNISSLILTGGWIESLYFATSINSSAKNQSIINRIGDQKQSLETIISLMKKFNEDGENNSIISDLEALKTSFDKIQFDYSFVEPVTNAEKHLTVLNHRSSVTVTDEVVAEINNKIKEIRTKIVG